MLGGKKVTDNARELNLQGSQKSCSSKNAAFLKEEKCEIKYQKKKVKSENGYFWDGRNQSVANRGLRMLYFSVSF